MNCTDKRDEDQGRQDNSFSVESVFCIINKILQEQKVNHKHHNSEVKSCAPKLCF